MRKLLIAILATGAMVSCSMDETVETKSPAAISFADSFVEGVTRANDPSTTTANITEFSVWSYMNAVDGYVFNDETVTKSGDKWTYANLQYWMPGNKYAFAAFAGDRSNDQVVGLPEAMAEESLSEITFKNVEGTNDILFAEAVVENAAENQAPVKFQFDHLLSKVKFTFKNGFANKNNYLVVKNIKMVVPYTGTVLLDQDQEYDWADQAGETTLDFGHMAEAAKVAIGKGASSDNERLTIPAAADEVAEYTVTFDVELYNGEQCGLQRAMEVKISQLELKPGRAYNFVATINQENLDLNVIEFTCEVDEWEEQEIDGGAVEEVVKFVTTAEELQEALNAATKGNVSVVLGADITATEPIIVPEVKGVGVVAINGNDYTFNGGFYINGNSWYHGGTTIFENINFTTSDKAGLTGDAFIYCGDRDGNLRYPDNVTIKDCTFAATDVTLEAVAAKFRSLTGELIMENCSGDSLHSMLQMLSCGKADVKIDKVTVENSINGLSLQHCQAAISNSTISTSGYGVRADGTKTVVSIKNSAIESGKPVVVRNVTADGFTLNIDEATTLTTEEDYQVIFTKGNDESYVIPTNAFTFNAPVEINVFPRIVTSADVLATALASDKGQTIVLAANIDLSEAAWTPVGTKEAKFSGMIDGMGHKITGLNIDAENAAFIAYADENATIKNLVIENAKIVGSKYAAALVINAENNVTVENVTVSGSVQAPSYAAGIVLMNNDDDDAVIIKNCTNNATVTSKRAGGVAAWVTGGTIIENCTNNGNIVGEISACGITNRIAGTITNCVNNGNIVGNGTEPSSGIAGTATAASTFEYCYNYGDVTTSSDNANASAAGILGQTPSKPATFNYCANYGKITAEQSYAAGIAYSLYGNIKANYCYNAGAVNGGDGAGAIAPKAQYGANDTANYCLNAGVITSANGKVYQGSNKNNSCYYYKEGALLNVADNSAVAEADALNVLNGGADADFFSTVDGKIVVK